MAEFQNLVEALTWLLTNRVQQKIDYTRGLLGDGNGRVRVSTVPGSPEVDYVYVRPDRFAKRAYKIFNKRVQGQDGDPVIVGELPWEPGLIQVVDIDWETYKQIGWGDDITTTNRHGQSHQWRDGAPGIDTFNVYRRQLGDLKTYPAASGTLSIGVSPYSLDIHGQQYQWPGIASYSLESARPAGTGTARMALVYWSPASGTTGFLDVATGSEGSSAEATILNRPVTPQGVIPSAFVRLAGGQTYITERDIWDAREPFRPGLSFVTGSYGVSADMIPISDTVGFYTGSTVEAALAEVPYKLIAPDGGINPVLSADSAGDITLAGTGTLSIPEQLLHAGDADTNLSFTDDQITFNVGGVNALSLIETTQDEVVINEGQADIDFRVEGDSQEYAIFSRASDDLVFFGRSNDQTGISNSNTSIIADRGIRIVGDGASAEFIAIAHGTSVFAFMSSRRARGSEASPSAVQSGDNLFRIGGAGYGATGWAASNRADIDIIAAENWTDANQGTYIRMRTTPTGSTGRIEAIRIHSTQHVSIGTTTDQGALCVYDNISGFLLWEYDGLNATVREIIGNGTGDVLYRLRAEYVMRDSAGAVASGSTDVSNSASVNLTVGTNTVRLRVNADGSADIARTAGADTIKVALTLRWL